ncbi:hypothetical protein ACFQ60_33290 [Streptomyces zhihengii]
MATMDAVTQVPAPVNEPVHGYAPVRPSAPAWRSSSRSLPRTRSSCR